MLNAGSPRHMYIGKEMDNPADAKYNHVGLLVVYCGVTLRN